MSTASDATDASERCLEAFREAIARAYRDDFGITDAEQVAYVAKSWFLCDDRHDHRFTEMEARLGDGVRFLDIASGMGTAVLRGLLRGHESYGIEPDAVKVSLTRQRIDCGDVPAGPSGATGRFTRAVGEALPFKDATFDAVLTYQTLEHVDDPSAVIAEILRVVRPGGGLSIRCPDYSGTFEGHYLLPWLPFFPRSAAKVFLRMLGRPVTGLHGIRYVTQGRIVRWIESAASVRGVSVTIEDLDAGRLRRRFRERGVPEALLPLVPLRFLDRVRRLFREELQVNLWVSVGESAGSIASPFSATTR